MPAGKARQVTRYPQIDVRISHPKEFHHEKRRATQVIVTEMLPNSVEHLVRQVLTFSLFSVHEMVRQSFSISIASGWPTRSGTGAPLKPGFGLGGVVCRA